MEYNLKGGGFLLTREYTFICKHLILFFVPGFHFHSQNMPAFRASVLKNTAALLFAITLI